MQIKKEAFFRLRCVIKKPLINEIYQQQKMNFGMMFYFNFKENGDGELGVLIGFRNPKMFQE